jgi:uracil-DNA glycosylase family 4
MSTLLLLDGNPIAHRAFHSLNLSKDGVKTSIQYGTLRILARLCDVFPEAVYVMCWDAGKSRFRREIYPEYKAHREQKRDDFDVEDFAKQLEGTRELLGLLAVPQVRVHGVEADDVMAMLSARLAPHFQRTILVGGDHDLWQLIDDDRGVSVYDTGKDVVVDEDAVMDRYGIPAKWITDYKALVGDASDGIPGAAGIGPKAATTALQTFGGLAGVYDAANADGVRGLPRKAGVKILEQREAVGRWYDLVLLLREQDLNQEEAAAYTAVLDGIRGLQPDFQSFARACEQLGFHSIVDDIEGFLARVRADATGAVAKALEASGLKPQEPTASALAKLHELPSIPTSVFAAPLDEAEPPAVPASQSPWIHLHYEHEWVQLNQDILACTKCPMRRECTQPVAGAGVVYASVMVVGRNPCEGEDYAGQLLDEMLTAWGLDRGRDVYMTNVLHCQSRGNRAPTEPEIIACRAFLQREVNLVNPRLIIALGNEAVEVLTGRDGVTRVAGSILPGTDCYGPVQVPKTAMVVPCVHPSGALRRADPMASLRSVQETVRQYLDSYPWLRDVRQDPQAE